MDDGHDISEILDESPPLERESMRESMYSRRRSRRVPALVLMVGVVSLYYSSCKPWIYEDQRQRVSEVGIGATILGLCMGFYARRRS